DLAGGDHGRHQRFRPRDRGPADGPGRPSASGRAGLPRAGDPGVAASMAISIYQASAPVFRQMLTALSSNLEKAEASAAERRIDPMVLLEYRLAPDMFPLIRQVQIATDHAKAAMSRLAGREPPRFPDEEASFAELRARI